METDFRNGDRQPASPAAPVEEVHPSIVKSNAFTNQCLAQLDRCANHAANKIRVYRPPGNWTTKSPACTSIASV
jgi:hypothetical protein